MINAKQAEDLKKQFLPKYQTVGQERFYQFLMYYALNKINKLEKKIIEDENPAIEFLDYYQKFLLLFRREGDEVFLEMSRMFRRAAHRTYRFMLRKQLTVRDANFLNVVQ